MRQVAVYSGSFDPLTYGHVDIIERALTVFDHLLVAVAVNTNKKAFLNIDERVGLIKQVFVQVDAKKLAVHPCDGLTVAFARQHGANILLRGLRTANDFNSEWQLAGMNRRLDAHIETLLLPASNQYMDISSTMVREIILMGGDVSALVPPAVASYLVNYYRSLS